MARLTIHLKKFLLAMLVAICLLFWGWIAIRLARYPENHIGFNFLWLNLVFGLTIAIAFWTPTRMRTRLLISGFALLSAVTSVALVHFSILVPYEFWLQAGMPERPF